MPRLALASLCALLCAPVSLGADSDPTPVEKQLAIQAAMSSARKSLDLNTPADAVAALEKELASADGNKAFLSLLREAYLAELYRLEKTPDANAERLSQMKRKLALLGAEAPASAQVPAVVLPPAPGVGTVPLATHTPAELGPSLVMPAAPQPAPAEAPASSPVNDAVAAFKKQDFAAAEKLFASVGAAKLTAEQKTAWAYCRIKLAAERVNAPACDTASAEAAIREVSEALELVTDNAKLLASGREVLKAAQAKAQANPARQGGGAVAPATSADVTETANFRVHHGGDRALGESVAKAAEASRKQIFERWSGPPGGAWGAKCDVVIHATADDYAKATGKAAALTGHATVTLANGRATARRIDLRADDSAMQTNALPRELTHVVLADLFTTAPPKWALEGMAILAGSPDEVGRYTRTLPRCARDNELRSLSALFELKDFPADKITGFYCQSVSLAQYLIGLGGEKNFKIFLGDAERYGASSVRKAEVLSMKKYAKRLQE